MLQTYEQHSRRKLLATVLSVVVIAGAVVFADHLKTMESGKTNTLTTTMPATAQPVSNTSGSAAAPATTSAYKDGTYTASSDYFVPHGNENIQVSLTLSGGVVTNASIQNSESNDVSASFQQDFAATYKSFVVGKKISGLKLNIISGASDTTQGFNDAVSQIASKART